MDLIDKLTELSARVQRQKGSVSTEEATKTAFILPFLQALGYDVFNPSEIIPEFTADHGVKKGEKVDYAISIDGKISMLIECKPVGAELEAKYAGQLFRYFSVTESRFGLLTDGIRYIFFSDLDKENRMDERPFFEFNLFQFDEQQVEELKKFGKTTFDLDTILGTANNLKYHKALLSEIKSEFNEPSEEFVRIFANRVYSGRFTQQIKEQFTTLTKSALNSYIRTTVKDRLQTALDTDKGNTDIPKIEDDNAGIITTEEEIQGYKIIQAISAEIIDPDRVYMRDAKSYCAIILDNNNRRTICRFYFGKTKLVFTIFTPSNEVKYELKKLSDIYQYKQDILEAIKQFD